MSKQCEKCEMYYNDMFENHWFIRLAYDGKTYYSEERDMCFDCLKNDDLLIKCQKCGDIVNEGFNVENKKLCVQYKENPNHYLSYRNNLGKLYLKVSETDDDKIKYGYGRTTYVYDKKTNLGWYCSLCHEKEHYIKLPAEFVDWEIYYNDLNVFEPLGYKFKDSDTTLQSGKSVMKVAPGMYAPKTKMRLWNRFDKIKKEERRVKGKNKVIGRKLIYDEKNDISI